MKTEISYIYGLYSTRNNIIRYIGYSCEPITRYKKHLRESKNLKYHRHKWIQKELLENFQIKLEILGCYKQEEIYSKEIEYIADFKSRGFNLVNGNDGGKGGLRNPSQEVRDKIRESKIGNKWNIGKIFSEEHRKKISEGHKGIRKSPEHIANMLASRIKNGTNRCKNRFLKEETVISILTDYDTNSYTIIELSKKYNVSYMQIYNLIKFDFNYSDIKEKYNLIKTR